MFTMKLTGTGQVRSIRLDELLSFVPCSAAFGLRDMDAT